MQCGIDIGDDNVMFSLQLHDGVGRNTVLAEQSVCPVIIKIILSL